MRRLLFVLALFVLSFVTAAGANAATYYVATTGNDSGDGSSGSPWLTLQHAVDTILAGDTILVEPGTYAGCRIRYSGTSGALKTLQVQTSGAVLLNGPGSANVRTSTLEMMQDNNSNPVEYWVVDGFEVTSTLRYGIDTIRAAHCIIRNCTAHNCAISGICTAFGDYLLVENCTSYSNSEHGLYMANSADYGTVRGCLSHNNVGNGLHMNADYNVQPGDGIMTGWTFDKNTLYGNVNGFDADGAELGVWSNNLAYGMTSGGGKCLHFVGADAAINSRSNTVVGNTFVLYGGWGSGWSPLDQIIGTTQTNPMTGYRIYNNILFNSAERDIRAAMCVSSTTLSDLQSDYNVMTEYVSFDADAWAESFSYWTGTRHFDQHSTLVHKTDDVNIWVSPSTNDWHLKSGSLAISKGTPRSECLTDKAGLTRPQGLYVDAGCYEYAEGVVGLDISPKTLPNATLTVSYSQTLIPGGGVMPYTWSPTVGGSLPPGLSWNATTAAISGTPTALGTYNFTVTLNDSNTPVGTATQALSITCVALPVHITTPFMRGGWVGTWYSQNLKQTGGSAPFHYALLSGTLPTGVTLNTSTGEISGTPSASGQYAFTLQALDSQTTQYTDQKQFTVSIASGSPSGAFHYVSTTGNNLWAGTVSQPWATLQYAVDNCPGGDTIIVEPGTYIGCRIESSTTAGAVKTLMAETPWGIVINSKEPTRAKHGSFLEVEKFGDTMQYWVIDGVELDGAGVSTYGIDVRVATHITVRNCNVHNALRTGIMAAHSDYGLIDNSVSFNNGEHGVYTSDSGDYGTLRNTVMHDNVGVGQHMNGGVNDGGDGIMSYWTIEKNTAYRNMNGFDADGVELSIWRNNLAYDNASKQLHFTGGDGTQNGAINSRNDRVINNTLIGPATGWIPLAVVPTTYSIGNPTGFRIFNNIIYSHIDGYMRGTMCMDSQGLSDFQSDYNLVMNGFALDANNQWMQLPAWQAMGYDLHSTYIGGTDAARRQALWVDSENADESLKDFHLKAGAVAIDAGTCVAADVSEDKDGISRPQGAHWDQGCYEYASGKVALTIESTSLAGGTIDVAYKQTLAGAGGSAPYTWAISSGTLPNGLSLDTAYGVISGTPTNTGVSNFTVRLTDSTTPTQQTATQALSITVTALPLVISTPYLRDGNTGTFYVQHLSATGGVTPLTWSVAGGSLPTGLSLVASTGAITGTPSATGQYTFTIHVVDSQTVPFTNDKSFTVAINGVLAGFNPYYVAASGGSDANPGTYGQPWATIQYAVDNCPAGGTVIVGPGTYIGFRIENCGTAAQPKTVMSETVGAAVVNAKHPTRTKHNSYMEVESFSRVVSYWIVDGFTVHGNKDSRYDIDLRNTNHISIINNIVDNSKYTGILAAFSEYVFIDRNTSTYSGEHGMYVCNSADYGVCSRNVLYGAVGCGIHTNGDLSLGGDGVMTGWLFEKNVAYSCGNGYDLDGIEFSTYKNNLAYQVSKGIHVAGNDSAVYSRYDRIVNNTLIANTGNFYPLYFWCDGAAAKPLPLGHRVFNNILFTYMNYVGGAPRGSICINSYMTADFQCDYNLVNDVFAKDENTITYTLAEWQALGYDVHGVHAVPTDDVNIWVDPANAVPGNRDFHLKAGSPAIDRGTSLSDVTDDITGMSRPQGSACDIGAYEYVVGGPAAMAVTTASLPGTLTNAGYSQQLSASGGVRPYTWSVASGTMPAGLGINPYTGLLSGTATAAGTFNFTVRASDSRVPAIYADKALSITATAGTVYEKTFQNGLNGYNGWQDTWISPDYPTTNFGSDTTAWLWYSTPDRQLHKMDVSSIPSGAAVNSATVSIYANNVYSSTTYVDLFRCITNWNVSQATYNNRLTGTAWSAAGLLMGTDFEGSPIGGSGEVTTIGWVNMDATRLVNAWVAGTYANEGLVLYAVTNNNIPVGGHINTNMSNYTADITLRPKLVVNYTAAGGSSVSITTTSLPGGNTGALYNQTLAATGGTTPYTWSIASGSLPTGLTLNASTGVISGTPGTGGTSSFTVKALDSVSAVATQALSIVVTVAQLQITTPSLASGTVGTAYSQTLAANGGIQPYTWSLAGGSLPTGLSLVASTGVISGTPSSGGAWSFTAQVADSQTTPATATAALAITIQTGGQIAVTITTTSLPNGARGALYSQTVVATGGQMPFTWTINSGSLPAGLSLGASTGIISGTPTTTGTSSFTVKVTDSQSPSATDTKALSILINPGTMTYYVATTGLDTNPGTSSQPWLTIQHAVDTMIGGDTAIVSAGTYAGARIRTSGSAAAVMTLKAATGASAVLNTPGTLCTTPSVVEVKADIVTAGVAYWLIDGFEITSSPNYGVEIQYGDHVTVQNCKVHASTANNVVMSYSNYCTLQNNEVYSNVGGSCMYIGQSGDYCVVRCNSIHNSASNAMFVTSDSGIGDRILTGWTIEKNTCYTNGSTSRMMSADGLVSSVIRNNLSYNTKKAIDLIGQNSAATSNNNRILNNTLVCTAGGFYVIYIHTATGGLPAGTNNTSLNNILYNYDPNYNRGTYCMDSSAESSFQSDYNVVQNVFALDDNSTIMDFTAWKLRGHDLHSKQSTDTALFINPATYDYHIKSDSLAKDGGTTVADVVDDIENVSRPVDAAYDIGCYEYHTSIPTLSVTTSTLPGGQVGVAYSQTVSATGGVTPYSWSLASGSLPGGLSLMASTGAISGTPTTYGTVSFTIQVVDSETPTPATATKALSIVVSPAPLSVTTGSLPNGAVSTLYNQAVSAAGGVTPYSWSLVSGSLPAGLSLNGSTGAISGTPTASGTSNFTVQATDSQTPTPATATKALSIVVNGAPLSITTSSMPSGTVNTAYSQALAATGGSTPYAWSIASGNLPAGLSLASSTGVISGTPTTSGTSSFTAQVTDSLSATATKAFSIVVSAATGNTYYVSTTGNDAWPGTISQPWATLQYAVDAISPGDTILVANGIYVGCHITSPGTAAAVKTLKNQTSGQGVIVNNRGGNVHNAVMDIDATSYWVIDGLVINGMDSYNYGFFTVLSNHITIRNCVSHGSVSSNFLSGFADYMLNENDEAFTTTVQHGFYNGDSDQYTTERGNLSHDNTGCAFHHNGGLPDGGLGEIRYLLAEKNIAYNNGGAVMNCDGVSDSKFINNLGYSNLHLGIALYQGDGAFPSSRDVIYNNTFHFSTTGYDCIQVINGAMDTKIKNNILMQERSEFGSIAVDTTSLGAGFESDYNVVVDRFTINNGDTYIPLSTWRGYGWDTHSIISTPSALFVSPGSNYHLKTGSPAIDAGTYVPGVYDDIEGTARPRGNGMDIGCYETAGALMDLVINTTTLPGAYVGFSYNQQIIAFGGQYPYTWSISSGSLPAGLSIDAAAGVVSGTATTTGTSSFTVHVADSQSPADTYDKALTIVATYMPLSITSTSMPSGQAGTPYAQALTAIGGAAPYTWSISAGSLPAGLSLISSSGLIAGTPTTAGTSSFTARVVDSATPAHGTVTQALSIVINAAGGGTTYYIATTGNDAWPGTLSQPWATLQYAVDTITPGDTILVADGVYTYGCHITSSGTSTAVKTIRSQNAGHGAIFQRPSSSNPHSSVIDIDTADYWVIDGIVANGMTSYNQAFFMTNSNHITIKNCVSHGSVWTNFLSGFCDYLLEENNEAFTTINQHGFYNANSNVYTIERANVSHDNVGCAFHHNGDASLGGDGEVRYLLAERNIAYNNGGAAENCSGVEDSKFVNNLIYNNNHLGIALYKGEGARPSSRNVIYNNTIHFSTSGYDCIQIIDGSIDNKIKNNILIQELTGFGSIATDTTSLGPNFESDYNVVVDRFSTDTNLPGGDNYITLSQWQAHGWDTHSIISTAAALFVSPGSDYHLKAGSPAINAGTTISEVTTDIEGNTRPQGGAYDCGCYEQVQSNPLTVTTSSLPADTVGIAYNQTLSASGGTTPYTWSLQAGSLPAGLSLVASTGAITGTPTASGTSSFTAKVTDNASATATQALSVVVNAAVSVTTASLPADTINIAYSQTLTATGGTGSLTWSTSSGSLPAGLSLNTSTGAITGTPTASGASSFTAKATDSVGASATQALSIVINAAPSITTSSLPADTINIAYNQTLVSTGGTSPLAWSVQSGSLPAGLSLNGSTGAITGTPTTSGTSSFTAKVTDNVGASATKALSITINAAVSVTTASLPADTINVAYNQTLAATGGTGALTWSISSGSLPAGLSLVSGTGAITGTPTATGTSSFTAKATDTVGASGTKALSIVINAALSISTSSLPADTINIGYNQTLAAAGGTSPLTWSLQSGSLPAGLSLTASTGAITGTPTTSGTSNFTAKVTDNVGATATKALSITINAAVSITTTSLPADTINIAYNQTLAASGGTAPLTWSLQSGSLPVGLSLNGSTGAITGTPTATGTSSFTAKVTDNVGASATKGLSIVINAAPSITTTSLPADTINIAYNQTLAASGGTTPYTWSIQSGSLPAGLSLVASTGAITGTPTATGTSSFTAKVTDNVTASATKALSIVINPAVSITTATLPSGQVGVLYNQTLAATGGTTPYTWSLAAGSLPAGLSLTASTGAITGTPTATGTSSFTAKVTDYVTASATKAFAITIVAADANYQFVASDTEGSTTSTAWQHKATLTFTVNVADTYVILAMAEAKESSTSYYNKTQVLVDATQVSTTQIAPKATTDYLSVMAAKVQSLAAGSHTIYVDYSSSSASGTAYIRNARIVALRQSGLELSSADQGDTGSNLTTTMTTYVTTSFTPATAGDYLLIWNGEWTASTTAQSTTIQANLNGSANDTVVMTNNNSSNKRVFMAVNMANLGASSQTISIAAQKGGGSTQHLERARVVAIRLSGSRFAGYQYGSSDTEATTTSTAFQNKLTKSWSVATAGNWLMMASCGLANTSTSYNTEMRQQLDATTTEVNPLMRTQAAANYMNGGCVDVRNLATGTRSFTVDYRTSNASGTAKVRNARLVAVPLQ